MVNTPKKIECSLGNQPSGKVGWRVPRGLRPVSRYERLASAILYTNRKPAYYLNRWRPGVRVACRQLRVVCTAAGGEVSNDYLQTVWTHWEPGSRNT